MTPFFSIIIPVYNGGEPFARCLASVVASTWHDWELIVVDDGSQDDSAELARSVAQHTLTTGGRLGPAAARNAGAEVATGQYLFFIDADCELHPNTLAQASAVLHTHSTLDALFGSYDDAPAATNFVSQYKNLLHHYVHQQSDPNANTFWTGCGCVMRTRFLALGGFDATRYPHPSIEDIEFGYRLTAAGGRIRLAKKVQVKHLKRWTTLSLLRSDFFDRALPWSALLLTRNSAETTLNLQWKQRLSVLLVALFSLMPLVPPLLPLLIAGLLLLNAPLYRFFYHKRGGRFTMRAMLYHWLYYGYSGAAFGIEFIRHAIQKRRSTTP